MLNRIKKIRKKISYPILLFGEENIRYFTGAPALGGVLLITKDNEYLITGDFDLARKTYIDNIIVPRKSASDEFSKLFKREKIKRLGVDFTSFALVYKKKLGNVKIFDISESLFQMRAIKDKKEIRNVKKACKISSKAMKIIKNSIKPGVTERRIRTKAMSVLNECEAQAFDFIVASGKNSMYSHSYPTNKRIKQKEMIIVDLGVKVKGYCSDMTRTFCIKPTKEQKKYYDITLHAYRTAFNNARSGISCSKLWKMVEKEFREKEVKRYWKYWLGHGVGLGIHEFPRLGEYSKDKLKENMTVAIEPGLHIHKIGGMRIEDTVLITKRKPKALTHFSYGLEV